MSKYNEIYKSKMDWQNVFVRTGNFPLDRSSIFGSYGDALEYAKATGNDSRQLGKTSYVGQIIAVYENDLVSIYKIVGKDVMDSETKTVQVKDRGLEELISRSDVETLISESILSEDFETKVKTIVSNEDIKADKVVTDEKITIVGTPLAQIINPSNSLDVTIDPNNIQEILKMLLEQELYPENINFVEGMVTPSVGQFTITPNITGTVEVGTEVTFPTIQAPIINHVTTDRKYFNISYGYSLSNNNTKEFEDTEIIRNGVNNSFVPGDYKFECNFTNFGNESKKTSVATTRESCFLNSFKVKVNEGINKVTVTFTAPKVTSEFGKIEEFYPCSNLQKTKSNVKVDGKDTYIATATTETKKEVSFSMTGAWYLYVKGLNGSFNLDSSSVRSLTKINLTSAGKITIEESTPCEKVVIAFPTKWGVLKSVKDNGSNTFITGNFVYNGNVPVTSANGVGSNDYKVYIYTPKNSLNGIKYEITIG